VWAVETGLEVAAAKVESSLPFAGVAWERAPGAAALAASSSDNTVRVWDPSRGAGEAETLNGLNAGAIRYSFTSPVVRLFQNSTFFCGFGCGRCVEWRPPSGATLPALPAVAAADGGDGTKPAKKGKPKREAGAAAAKPSRPRKKAKLE
jgi:hypothetical protein